MDANPMEDTEPHVQRLFHGSYRETDMEPQGLAGVGLCVICASLTIHHNFMDQRLSVLGNTISQWIVKTAKSSADNFIDQVNSGNLDLTDLQIRINEKTLEKTIFTEFVFIYFRLASFYLHHKYPEHEHDVLNYLAENVYKELNGTDWDGYVDLYNERSLHYANFPELTSQNNDKNTLFWEFGKMISKIVADQDEVITIVLMIKSILVSDLANLWKLEI